MTFVSRVRRLSLMIVAVLILAAPAGAQYKKQNQNKQNRHMSGVISSIESSGGMLTVRLDNGDVFTAPVDKVRVRDMRASADLKAQTDAANTAPRRRAVAASSNSLVAGDRVVVRRKLDKEGNLKRVVVRIVEQ